MPNEQLAIAVEDAAGGECLVTLTGVLTIATLFEFQSFARADQSASLIVDLNGLSYLDSAGLGTLINAYVSRQKSGRKLTLVGVNERVKTVMRVTNVDQFFTICGTIEEARGAGAGD